MPRSTFSARLQLLDIRRPALYCSRNHSDKHLNANFSMNLKSSLLPMLRSVLAFFLGSLALILTVFPSGIVIESVFPGAMETGGFPNIFPAQFLLLLIEFIGGTLGTLVVILAAPGTLLLHAVLFGALILALNILTITSGASIWPLWASIVLLAAVPVEVWVGYGLGNYIRGGEVKSDKN